MSGRHPSRTQRREALLALAAIVLAGSLHCGGAEPSRPELDGAIGRASAWLTRHAARPEPQWQGLLAYYARRFGFVIRSGEGRPLHLPLANARTVGPARVFARLVDPGATVRREWIDALPTAIDRMTARALYCDRIPLPDEWIEALTGATRLGGYALTHAVLALHWSLEQACLEPGSAVVLRRAQRAGLLRLIGEPESLARSFATPTDLWLEAVAMLSYGFGADEIRGTWRRRVLMLQLPEGAWPSNEWRPEPDAHATALALWPLLEARYPDAPAIRWVPELPGPRASEPPRFLRRLN